MLSIFWNFSKNIKIFKLLFIIYINPIIYFKYFKKKVVRDFCIFEFLKNCVSISSAQECAAKVGLGSRAANVRNANLRRPMVIKHLFGYKVGLKAPGAGDRNALLNCRMVRLSLMIFSFCHCGQSR